MKRAMMAMAAWAMLAGAAPAADGVEALRLAERRLGDSKRAVAGPRSAGRRRAAE